MMVWRRRKRRGKEEEGEWVGKGEEGEEGEEKLVLPHIYHFFPLEEAKV